MKAAREFLEQLQCRQILSKIVAINVVLYGSLAFTGKGHGTDKAIAMGLLGEQPHTIDPDTIPSKWDCIAHTGQLSLLGQHSIPFIIATDLIFNYQEKLTKHTNGMRFLAYAENNKLLDTQIYYSVGGGFIIKEEAFDKLPDQPQQVPYTFSTAQELLSKCKNNQLTISQLMLANEIVYQSESKVKQGLLEIAAVMQACIQKGCSTSGILPGGLNVRRRAPALFDKLQQQGLPNNHHPDVMNWINVYAMAVNEENAAGGKVVTAPTNGAAGIIPAVLQYYKTFYPQANDEGVVDFLLTAAAIAILYKLQASISGAEVGCQGEVGVACSMAAGALVAVLGGSLAQIENAAEIGMEHNLGLPCDPPKGLVQIPCIERNAMGAVKAINAAQLALAEDGNHKVSLDAVIKTMRQIGKDMETKYKETSLGGLAVNIIEC